jgi:signal transduction histidine kinase
MDEQLPNPDTAAVAEPRRGIGLAARVLVLIIIFVMVAEIAIFIPSVASFRNGWLATRLSAAYTAALVLEAAPEGLTSDSLKNALLDAVGAKMIVLKTKDIRRLLAVNDIPPEIDEMEDLRRFSMFGSIAAAYRALTAEPGRILDVRAAAPAGAEFIEIAMDERPLQAAMREYSANIFMLSLAISLFVALLAALALNWMVLAPMRRLTSNVIAFAAAPEDRSRIITPSGSTHEIGEAEHALAAMETSLARELREKKRLAELGLAVAKINHDLRNMLTPAQLLSDRLIQATDPIVSRNATKLVATLDRAIRFCQATLTYGRLTEETPRLALVDLQPIAGEAVEAAVAGARTSIEGRNTMAAPLMAMADAEQMFRVFNNLCRNAAEALDQAGPAGHHAAAISVTGERKGERIVLRVCDTGPGLPAQARRNLFVAFQGSARPGGTGLGLTIAADLVRGHGGTIRAVDTDPNGDWPGACFEIDLPALAK